MISVSLAFDPDAGAPVRKCGFREEPPRYYGAVTGERQVRGKGAAGAWTRAFIHDPHKFLALLTFLI